MSAESKLGKIRVEMGGKKLENESVVFESDCTVTIRLGMQASQAKRKREIRIDSAWISPEGPNFDLEVAKRGVL